MREYDKTKMETLRKSCEHTNRQLFVNEFAPMDSVIAYLVNNEKGSQLLYLHNIRVKSNKNTDTWEYVPTGAVVFSEVTAETVFTAMKQKKLPIVDMEKLALEANLSKLEQATKEIKERLSAMKAGK